MKLIIFAEKEVANSDEAGRIIKEISVIAKVCDFQVQDEALKDEIRDKAELEAQ